MSLFVTGAAAVLFATLERGALRFRAAPLLRAHFTSDVVYWLTGYGAGGLLTVAYFTHVTDWVGAWLPVPRLAGAGLPLWVSVAIALVAIDLGGYLCHWLLHRVDFLWEFHKVHHSSRTLDWLATFRSHLVEQAFRRVLTPLLLVLVGAPIEAVTFAAGLQTAWAMLNHSNLRVNLRFLEPVLITPRLHRVHHVPRTTERNLGTVFTLWDQLRGTLLHIEPDEGEFGVPGEVTSYPQGWARQLVEPVRRVAGAPRRSLASV